MRIPTSSLLLLGLPAIHCVAQEGADTIVSTDRPSVGTSADIVRAHTLLVENGFSLLGGQDGSSVDGSETLLRYGIGRRTELRALLPNRDRMRSAPGEHWQDTAFGTKIGLPSIGLWQFTTGANLSIPTGSTGTSSGGWDPSLLGIVAHPLSRTLAATVSANFGWFSNGSGTREKDLQLAFDVSWSASRTVTPFLEYAPAWSSTPGAGSYVAQAGTTWLVRPRVQLDARVGSNVKAEGPELVSGVGMSFLLAPFRRQEPR